MQHRRLPKLNTQYQNAFWSLVEVGDAAVCWDWKGELGSDGYPVFLGLRATRVTLWLQSDQTIQPTNALHSCNRPRCCNPNHLRSDTQKENIRQSIDEERFFRHGPGQRALSSDQVQTIRQSREQDYVLADRFGVSHGTVRKVRANKTYKDVK